MRKLFIITALVLITACSNDIPRSEVIFISVAASYGKEGEMNYLANPPGDQRALSEQMAYMTERRELPYTEHIFLERDGRMSVSGEEKDWGRHDILDLLETLEAGPDDLLIFHYSGHGDTNGSLVMPDGGKLTPDELLYALRKVPGFKCAFIDSCYSGRFVRDTGSLTSGERFTDGKLVSESFINAMLPSLKMLFTAGCPANDRMWILSAATSGQLSYDSWDDGRDRQNEFGAFSYYLLKALGYRMDEGTPGLGGNRITFYGLYDSIKNMMSDTLWRQATPQATLTPVDLILF